MKRAGAVLIGLALVGCETPTIPTITNVNTNTNILNGGGGIQDPNAVAGTCTAEEQTPIRVDLNVPSSVGIGASTGIDATPKSASGKRSDQCNLLQGILWTTIPPTICSVREPGVFNTSVHGDAAGVCTLTACVPGKGACGTTTILVQ